MDNILDQCYEARTRRYIIPKTRETLRYIPICDIRTVYLHIERILAYTKSVYCGGQRIVCERCIVCTQVQHPRQNGSIYRRQHVNI